MLPNLIEWAVRECGAGRLLFGSDTPLYHVALQRCRIECADIPAANKEQILFRNALVFFNLELRPSTRVAAESHHA
jgi:predicted TIM-barrel fold metal-dependent hydrolase